MRVDFSNAQIDVWKLKKGVVLGCGPEYVHIVSFAIYEDKQAIRVEYHDGVQRVYSPQLLEWLEPH